MRWKREPAPAAFSVRYVYRYAYFPSLDITSNEWVWFERYVAREYYSPSFRGWMSDNTERFATGSIVFDCRRER